MCVCHLINVSELTYNRSIDLSIKKLDQQQVCTFEVVKQNYLNGNCILSTTMNDNYVKEIPLVDNKDDTKDKADSIFNFAIKSGNSVDHLHDTRGDKENSPGPKYCRKRSKLDGDDSQHWARARGKSNHVTSPRSLVTPCTSTSLKAHRDFIEGRNVTLTPYVSVLPCAKERKVLSPKDIASQASLILKPVAKIPQWLQLHQQPAHGAPLTAMATGTAGVYSESRVVMLKTNALSSRSFGAALPIFLVDGQSSLPESHSASQQGLPSADTITDPDGISFRVSEDGMSKLHTGTRSANADFEADLPVVTITPVPVCRSDEMPLPSQVPAYRAELQLDVFDSQPSTSGLHIPVAIDEDGSDADGDDVEAHLRTNLYPPVRSLSSWSSVTKGAKGGKGAKGAKGSKSKSSYDKPKSKDAVDRSHDVEVDPSNSTLTRELVSRIRNVSPFCVSSVEINVYAVFSDCIDVDDYVYELNTSTAFSDTTHLEVPLRKDVSIRFATCEWCGIPRYLKRDRQRQVWFPTKVTDHVSSDPLPCLHSEPTHREHFWWKFVFDSGLIPFNPSRFPFKLIFGRLGTDLTDLSLAALVVSGIYPILNWSNILLQWPIIRKSLIETDEQLLETAAGAFINWLRNVQVVSGSFFRPCPLCGISLDDNELHFGIQQPAVCRTVVNFVECEYLGSRLRHLVGQNRPIVLTSRPSVEALLNALNKATGIQVQAVAILFSLVGAVILTVDDTGPQLFNAGPFISRFCYCIQRY